MSYNAFFDFYFSSGFISFGLTVLFTVLIFIIFRKPLYFNRKRKKLIIAIFSCIPFLWMISYGLFNPGYLGYGAPKEVTSIQVVNGKLLITDYIRTAGGKGSNGIRHFRTHMLDPLTGEKKLRFGIGLVNTMTAVHGDTLIVTYYDQVNFYSLKDGEELAVWSKETLPKLFPQLAAGIVDMSTGDGSGFAYINALDGQKWKLNAMTGELILNNSQYTNNKVPPLNKLYLDGNDVKLSDGEYPAIIVSLEGNDGNDNLRMICDENDSVLNPALKFIDGFPVMLSEKNNSFVILHYETLAKEKFLLTCVSLDGKRKLWEVKQATLNPDYVLETPQVITGSDEQNGNLIFCFDKEVFAVRVADGKLLWRTKL